jgi:hypothetical protein
MKPFFFLLLILSNTAYAQRLSNESAIKDKMGTHYLVEKDKLIRLNLESVKVFDLKGLALLKEISLKTLPKDWMPIDFIQFQGKILLFYKSTPETNILPGYYHLYCQEINIKEGKLTKKARLITGLPQDFSIGLRKERKNVYYPKPSSAFAFNYPYVKITQSQDYTKLMVSNAGLHGLAFNADMEPIIKYAISDFSDKKNLITIAEAVDNEGNYHAIAKLYEFEDEFNYTFGRNFYKYDYNLVYLYSEVKGETTMTQIDKLAGNQIACANLKQLSNGKMVCLGAYGETKKNIGLEHGVFTFYTSAMDDLIKIQFTSDDIRKNDVLKSQGKMKTLLNSVDLFEGDDGELLAVGERVAFNDTWSVNGLVTYRNVVMVKLDQDLRKVWLHRLPKKVAYSGLDYGGGSYKYAFLNEAHYVFFLDHKANFLKDIKDKPLSCGSSAEGNLTAYCVKGSGRVSKVSLYENFKSQKGLQIHSIQQISNTKIIFEHSINNNNSILTTFSFDK